MVAIFITVSVILALLALIAGLVIIKFAGRMTGNNIISTIHEKIKRATHVILMTDRIRKYIQDKTRECIPDNELLGEFIRDKPIRPLTELREERVHYMFGVDNNNHIVEDESCKLTSDDGISDILAKLYQKEDEIALLEVEEYA